MIDIIGFWLIYGIIIAPFVFVAATFALHVTDFAIEWVTRNRKESNLCGEVIGNRFNDWPEVVKIYMVFGGLFEGFIVAVWALCFLVKDPVRTPFDFLLAITEKLTPYLSMPMFVIGLSIAALFGLRKLSDTFYKLSDVLGKGVAKGDAEEAPEKAPVAFKGNYTKLPVGTKVKTKNGDVGMIDEIYSPAHCTYPVSVIFEDGEISSYTHTGRYYSKTRDKRDLVGLA